MSSRREHDAWWSAARALADPIFHATFRIRLAGLKHVPAEGPAILAANHVSVLDPILIALSAYRRGRVTRFLGIAQAFRAPIVGWALERLDQIPLRRGEGDRSALQEARRTLDRGRVVGIFPEGRVGTGPGLLRGRTGVARLAAGGAPVIPVGVWGTQKRWPRAGLHLGPPLRPPAWVAFGPPVPGTSGASSRDELREVADRVMRHIADLIERAKVAGSQSSE